MSDQIKILIVEDTMTDAELAMREINKALKDCVFERVETESEYLHALSVLQPDLVLSDYNLPTFDGMRAIYLLRANSPLTPLIIWTGSINEETAVECMKAGAVNYVIKDNIKRLGTAVIHALEERKISIARKKADEELIESKIALEKSNSFNISVFDSLSEHIAVIDGDGRIIAVNAAWKQFAIENGASESLHSFIGSNYLNACAVDRNNPQDEADDMLSASIGIRSVIDGNLKVYSMEYPCHSPTEKRWFLLQASPRLYERGAVISHVNITERKLLEQQKEKLILELTGNNNDLLQFSYIVSHNLQAPLSNLLGLLSLLEGIEIKDEDLASILNGFRISTNALNQTLKDLHKIIVIRQQPSILFEDIDLNEMVENIRGQINDLIIQSFPEIDIDFGKLSVIRFNKPYLESIFSNLFTNAIKYRSPDRKLKISVRIKDVGTQYQMSFEDNGLGIDLDRYRDRIFGLYQRFHEHPESKGFGLYLIKSQIEALGGTIHIENKVNVGTKFKINFLKEI